MGDSFGNEFLGSKFNSSTTESSANPGTPSSPTAPSLASPRTYFTMMWYSTREVGRPPTSRVRSSTGVLFSSSSSWKTWSGCYQQRLHTQDLPGLSVTENNDIEIQGCFPSVSSHSNY